MSGLIGIDDLKRDLFTSIGLGIVFIVANILGAFSMALPPVASTLATNVGRLMVIVIVAPIIEEVMFRGVLLNLFLSIFRGKVFLAIIAQALCFGAFHMVAYSGILIESFEISPIIAASGAFLSASIFGFIVGYMAYKKNNLLLGMIPHAMINFWLVRGLLVVV